VATQPTWKELKEIYKKVYLPLITEVVPSLESNFLTHRGERILLSSFYDIAAQTNGRMKCHKALSRCYNPHSITDDDKNNLAPTRYETKFLNLDFKHMEVSVLGWLTNDPVLGEILASGNDLYTSIWKKLTTIDADAVQRQKCKDVFLPVVFGLGVEGVAEKLKVSEATAGKLVDRIYLIFSVAMDWIKRRQNSLDENNYSYDFFGKRRRFEDRLYRVRNFQVQSPAALVCLHKLVRLHEALATDDGKLAYHVHDGYMVLADKASWIKTTQLAKQVLESAEDMYPGLKLKVSCSIGDTMAAMKSI
jgi:DNA polymerase I-like protein with 3'-5' exonuclease and polymerase domains